VKLDDSWAKWIVGVAIAAFVVLGVARLNPFCLFEPDEPEYLFGARSLAQFQGLRELDRPGEPLHVFRPPGLPILLAPLALLRPYDVPAAKIVVLLSGAAALWLMTRYAGSTGARAIDAALVALLVAASPYALLHATQVVAELPFLAAALGALWIVQATYDRPSKAAFWTLVACLAAASLLRTIGGALIAALALFALLRRKQVFLLAAAVSAIPTLVWMWRSARTGAPTYLGAVADAVRRLGFDGYLGSALRQAGWYLERLPALILPGLSTGHPVYERVLLDAAPDVGFHAAFPAILGALIAVAALIGMWRGRALGGSLAALFTLAYFVLLAVYPPRHERLAWPIVPILWIWAAIAVRGAVPWWVRQGKLFARVGALEVAIVVGTALAGSLTASVAMVRANLAYRGERDAFYVERMPPMYWSDWQAAGRSIAAKSAEHERVLTRHSDLAFTSRRSQESIRFEEVSPQQWRAAIAALPARFLALPDTRCGEGIRWQAFDGDPAYRYVETHAGRGAVVFTIEPNREGTVRLDSPLLAKRIEACRQAVAAHPDRVDLRRRLADLLGDAGRPEEGLSLLQAGQAESAGLAEILLTRAELLLDLDRLPEARSALDQAARSEGIERLENSLARGRRNFDDKLARASLPPEELAHRLAREGLDRLDVLDPRAAALRIARAERLAPHDREVLAARATLARRVGRADESRELFTQLAAAGDRAAATMVAEMERETALASGALDAQPGEWLRVARFQAADGAPGKALATLERAAQRFPRHPAIRKSLADLYLVFGDAGHAEPILRQLSGEAPSEPSIAKGLARCDELLRPAEF